MGHFRIAGGKHIHSNYIINLEPPVTYYITTTIYETATSYITKTSTSTMIFNVTTRPQPISCAIFEALKDSFRKSEPVAFRLINNYDEDLILPNSAPWIVKSYNGEIVFFPIILQVITEIEPGSYREWFEDNQGKSVDRGVLHNPRNNKQRIIYDKIRIQ